MKLDQVAVFVVFAINGAAIGSWATRVPALTEQVHAAPGEFGLALLGASIGMLLAASMSGRLAERFGSRSMIVASTLAACATLPVLGLVQSVAWLGVALFFLGASVGALDVSMNISAVSAERRAGKPIMPIFHAGFSFGALVGAAASGLAASHNWSPARHLGAAALVAVVVLLIVVRALPTAMPRVTESKEVAPAGGAAPIRRPALWLLAAIALCSAIAEGASGEWSALLLVTSHGTSQGAAALGYGAFSLAMGLTRLGGVRVQARFGASRTLAVGAALAGFGLVVAAVIPVPALGFAGFALAGAGLAGAFPVALSLAGDAGKRADGSGGERELAFVTTIAYTGFLAGPPMIGGIAQLTSLSTSFVVAGFLAVLIAPAAIAANRARSRELVAV